MNPSAISPHLKVDWLHSLFAHYVAQELLVDLRFQNQPVDQGGRRQRASSVQTPDQNVFTAIVASLNQGF